MNVITIEHSAFQQIADRLEAIERGLHQRAGEQFHATWLDGQKVMEMLGIGRRTLQNYRNQGRLGFSRIGKKVFYRASDVQAFIDRHYQNPFRVGR